MDNRSICSRALAIACAPALLVSAMSVQGAERAIEEIIVTAERVESTVSDTSISITAFAEEALEDLGIQGADEMINYIPATTRDDYDIRVRGIGRNFRSLGGDPGVATYYNGVYSEDFGIAATENALYDVERIEVLRGPQGTLYGRNSIGGALNYITRAPTFDWTGELRMQVGNYNERELYGAISGPIVGDSLAARLTATKLRRKGDMEGQLGSEDINSVNDRNYALELKWRPSDTIEANMRVNDRKSDRIIGMSVLIDEGPPGMTGTRMTDIYSYELTPVPPGTPGAITYVHPDPTNPNLPASVTDNIYDGKYMYAVWARPGLDGDGCWPCLPSAAYGVDGLFLNSPNDLDGVDHIAFTNDENWERFVHNALSFDITWDISDRTTLKYIGGYWDQLYEYDIDVDNSTGTLSDYRFLDAEGVTGYSHELQLFWGIGDNLRVTSGAYNYFSHRVQDWGMANPAQERITSPVSYGAALDWAGPMGPHRGPSNVARQSLNYGIWEGDPDGYYYHHRNKLDNTSYAVYTQGVYTFNDRWSLTAGVRWAQDTKKAYESRGYYWEDFNLIPTWAFDAYYSGYWTWLTGPGVPFSATGLTPIGMDNILMGNAYYGGPANPVVPVCALDDEDCATPLRLGGIPGSQWSIIGGEHTWSDVTYRLNMEWTPSEDALIYFGVTTGYRSGGYALGVSEGRDVPRDANGVPTGAPTDLGPPFSYDPETVVAWELGYKGKLLSNTLQIFASAYTYDYEGYQDETNVWDPNRQQGVTIVTNAGKAFNRGLEVEFIWLPTDRVTLGGNYSYTLAEYDEDFFVVGDDDPNVVPSLMGNVAVLPELYTVNVNGNQIKRIPKKKGVLWGSYRITTGHGTYDLQATWSYTGEYDSNYKGRPEDMTPSRTRTDIGILWIDTRDQWRVRLFADNVFDKTNFNTIGRGSEGGNWAVTGQLLAPRYVGLNIIRKFGAQ